MTTNTAPSTTSMPAAHEHTLQTAVDCFDGAVDKNVARFKEPISAAVRRALPWGEGTLLKQIKDPEQAKAFSAFLDRERAEHPKPVREERPKGPELLTALVAKAKLEASERPFVLAEDMYKKMRRWDPSEIQKIEGAINDVLGTAKRRQIAPEGTMLTEEMIAQAAEEVKNFIARVKRSTQPRQKTGNRRPQGNSGSHNGSPRFSNSLTAERKHDAPKVTGKPSDLEKQAAALKTTIAEMEEALKALPPEEGNETRADVRRAAIDAVKAKKQELADVRAKIAADHATRADAKKQQRIASAQASSKASLTIPATYKVKEKQAKPETQAKGKKRR